ncbi:MAG TPA: aminopeptidase [Candidatus Bathyarchaeia archaeon]|nr:aminopeptidase [Candidatus Bathyarchaeia archaeon]
MYPRTGMVEIDPRLPDDNIAKHVVNTSLKIREDDMVLIETWQHTIDLASDIALECYRAGAKPLMTLMTDRLWWKALEEIPEQYFRKTPRHVLNAVESVTVWIGLGGPEDPTKFREVPSSRLEPFFEGEKPVVDKTIERKIRAIEVLVGHVTPQRAKAYGFDYPRWLKNTHDAINVDYLKMTQVGKKIANQLQRASRIHLTSKLGTDLRFDIAKRPVHVQDGIVDDEDRERGLVSTQLPSGKVEVPPIEESARGTVIFDTPRALKGRLIHELQFVFEKGRIKEFHAKKYGDVFREVFEATQGDKDRIGQFAIGLNPRIELIGYITDELALGTASIGIGANKGIGGLNDSSFYFSGTITKPTIEVDGSPLMVDGKLNMIYP